MELKAHFIYESSSLPLVAFLIARGHKITGQRTGEKGRVFFAFDKTDPLHTSIDAYYANDPVNAQDYWNAIKLVKHRLHNLHI